jgi:GMP synthase-like glutamine amidotransferase
VWEGNRAWSRSTTTASTSPCSLPTTDVRIGLLLCGDLPDRYNAISGDYPSMVADMFEDDDAVSLTVFNAHKGDLPHDLSTLDGFIVSGSASSVYDDEQWIRDLEDFIRRTSESSVPIFGICFGHQVIAKALGGTVERAENGWGIGIHTMRVLEARPWMNPAHESLKLVMAHQDQVVSLPHDAVLLGSSDHCKNYLIEFTPSSVGVQGHPEFPGPFAEVLYEDKREHLGGLVDDAIASLALSTDSEIIAAWMKNVLRR